MMRVGVSAGIRVVARTWAGAYARVCKRVK